MRGSGWITKPIARCFGLLAFAIPPQVSAGPVVVYSDPADKVIRKNGQLSDAMAGRVGASASAPGAGSRASVFVFQLPPVGPGEAPGVTDASFEFTILADLADGQYSIDLYAIPARSSAAVTAADNYFGPLDESDAILIQNDIILSTNSLTGVVRTSPSANLALVNYLNAQYGLDGSGAGKYVFLRLNPDQDPPSQHTGVDVAQSENDSGWPALTITFVPEPSWIALLPCALLVLGARRAEGIRQQKFALRRC